MFSSEFGNEQIDNRVQEEKTEPGMPQTKNGGMSGNVWSRTLLVIGGYIISLENFV